MSNRDLKALQSRIDAKEWYHEFDFGDGLRATTKSDVESHRRIWAFIHSNLSGVDFRGKTVLDIGAWDGYWSFHAERNGAKHVLATDDATQNWADGTGIHLAKELFRSRIEIDQGTSVYNLASLKRKFDIILFLGVYYHLHDPFYALSQIRHCCHENTLVLIEGPVATGLVMGGTVLNFLDHSKEFLPGVDALRQLTDAAYFREDSSKLLFRDQVSCEVPEGKLPLAASPTHQPGRLGWRWRLKLCQQALQGSRTNLKSMIDGVVPPMATDILRPDQTDRIFLRCGAYHGKNEIHAYSPPFGLGEYDDRFRNAASRAA